MKTLILGGYGLLGSDIYDVFEAAGHHTVRTSKDECDITDIQSIKSAISKYKPELIIHTAGFTNVDLAEEEPLKAYDVNSMSMYNILNSCIEIKPIIIFVSTDYVFSGEQVLPYIEESQRQPLNVYGRSKLLAEDILRANYDRYYIVRSSWLFGKNGKCFPDTILQKLVHQTSELHIVNDQFGCPTYTVDLAKSITQLLGCPFGIYHITNSGSASWYELAQLVAKEKNFTEKCIQPIHSGGYVTKATRPKNSILDNSKWVSYMSPLRHYSEALHSYFINK